MTGENDPLFVDSHNFLNRRKFCVNLY